jgi:hypothetical protein
MDQMLMDVMRIVGFKGDFPLNDRLYGRAQSRTNFPSSRIVGVPTDVRAVTDLFKSDLVIDATGEEPVSEMKLSLRPDFGDNTLCINNRLRITLHRHCPLTDNLRFDIMHLGRSQIC